MKFDVKIHFEESYLPSKRHSIPRIREIEETVPVELREVSSKDTSVAMIVSGYKSYLDAAGKNLFGLRETPFLALEGLLYTEKRDMRGALDEGPYSMEAFQKAASRAGDCYYTRHIEGGADRETVLRSLKEFMDNHVLIDGVLHKKANEPRYVVMTFGMGNNHGSTALMITYGYNENISKSAYFNALQKEAAIEHATAVATRRGDTDSLGSIGNIGIQVLLPEMVHCEPNLEYGNNGNRVSLNDQIQAASEKVGKDVRCSDNLEKISDFQR